MGNQQNQGSLGLGHKSQSFPPFPATAAENGVSVDPVTGKIVLGNDVGSFDAVLLSDREIPGTNGIALPNGRFGVGFPGNVVGGAIQNLLATLDFFNNENVQSTCFIQLQSTPTGNNLVGTVVPLAAQNVFNFSNGFLTQGVGTRVAEFKGTTQVIGNNGTKTLPPLISFLTGFVAQSVLRLADVVGLVADGPDNTFGPTGTIDRLIGIHIRDQNTMGGVVIGQRLAILQDGVNDQIVFAGIPARTAASDVVVRQQGTNQLKRIAGASGTFTTADGKTVTVVDGVITAIV